MSTLQVLEDISTCWWTRTRSPILDLAERRGRRFALEVPVPYLTEGAHVLSLRTNGEQPVPGWCRRTVHFHRPAQATVTSFDR